jgi:uncharacterized protein
LESSEISIAFLRHCKDGLELRIKVVPGASHSKIAGVLGDRLKIRIAAPPEKGKANEALLSLMAKWLGTKNVQLVAGHGNAEKTVRVVGLYELSPQQLSYVAGIGTNSIAGNRMDIGS